MRFSAATRGHYQPDRIPIQQRQVLIIHQISDHHLVVARIVDSQGLLDVRAFAGSHRGRRSAPARSGSHPGVIEKVFQPHSCPARVAHRPVGPCPPGTRGSKKLRPYRSIGHGDDVEPLEFAREVIERQLDGPIDDPAYSEPETSQDRSRSGCSPSATAHRIDRRASARPDRRLRRVSRAMAIATLAGLCSTSAESPTSAAGCR